ncbi:MAG: SDR family NAD(P)-dependent oxidoreductase [Chthoniobacterales bacterium]
MARFSEQIFLVTGASGGVGGAIARALGQEGATVCLTGRSRKRLEELAAQLPGKQGQCYPADLMDESGLEAMAKEILAQNRQLHGVIHCAAIIAMQSFARASVADFERQFKTNVLGPFRLTQLLLPALGFSQGQVIFINSSAGREARAGVGQYAATKHALKAVADSLRDECNSSGVRVCTLFLGSTATPMQAGVRAWQRRSYEPEKLIQPDDVAGMVAAILALPRTAEVTDVIMRPTAKT